MYFLLNLTTSILNPGMPASTLEPVSAALRNALSKNSSEDFLSSQLSGSSKRVLCTNIEFEPTESYQSTVLTNLKSKYIVLQPSKTAPQSKKLEMGTDETLALPQKVLYPLENVQLGWNNSDWSVGAGMVNMGNTCYLNSTLQALFHVPALVNWLLSDKQHMIQCEDSGGGQGGCIICAMSKTLQASQQRNANAIRPWLVYSKLRIVCRHLVPGRQEDAHEFLRYLVEAMERAYIQRFRNMAPLDTRSKETTPLNQILGGYLRSAVRCLECGHVSTTFQHFQDLLLDIRKINTLEDALDLYFSREKLDDMAYHCENCQKKVLATKQFSLERAPMVLCIQLKRFSVSNNKITKHITFRQRLELTRFARRKPSVPLVYRLVSLVTHVGQTVGCGHYTAVAQAPSGNFYQFDDSMVRPISQQSMFGTNAYIMLYELECSHSISPKSSPVIANKNNFKLSDESLHTKKESTSLPLNNLSSSSCSSLITVNGFSSKSSNLLPNHSPSYKQNGNGKCANGNQNRADSSDSDDSAHDTNAARENTPHKNNKSASSSPKITSSPKSSTNSPNSSLSSFNSTLNSPPKEEPSTTPPPPTPNHQQTKTKPDEQTERKPLKQFQENSVSSSTQHQPQPVTKLVPYEVDDSSSSTEDSQSQPTNDSKFVSTKGWQVSMNNTFHGPSLEGQTSWNRRSREIAAELMQQHSHEGYAAPVNSWNGNRSALDREISNERREDRKRTMNDSNPDKFKVKQPKYNNSHMGSKSNPGYNPFQEYSNSRKWQTDSHYYNKSHYNGMGHRYQRRGNYHNNRHRDKFRH